MGEIVPRVAVLAVVLADGAPLPFAEVGSPFLPRNSRLARVVQPLLFCDVDDLLLRQNVSPGSRLDGRHTHHLTEAQKIIVISDMTSMGVDLFTRTDEQYNARARIPPTSTFSRLVGLQFQAWSRRDRRAVKRESAADYTRAPIAGGAHSFLGICKSASTQPGAFASLCARTDRGCVIMTGVIVKSDLSCLKPTALHIRGTSGCSFGHPDATACGSRHCFDRYNWPFSEGAVRRLRLKLSRWVS